MPSKVGDPVPPPLVLPGLVVHEFAPGSPPVRAVDAKEIHRVLGIATRFNDWFGRRVADRGLREGEHYALARPPDPASGQGRLHLVAIEVAVALSVLEDAPRGHRVLRGLVERERAAFEAAQAAADRVVALERELRAASARLAYLDCEDRLRVATEQAGAAEARRRVLAGELDGLARAVRGGGAPGLAEPAGVPVRRAAVALVGRRSLSGRPGHAGVPDEAVLDVIRRAGLEDRSRSRGRAPGPGATAAGDAVRRLVLRWGVDAAATVLSALAAASRSGQPFAVTTAVVRAYADLSSSWHGLPREPGFAAVATGLDYEGMRASLRAEGVGNGYPLFAALRPAICSALREAFAATGP